MTGQPIGRPGLPHSRSPACRTPAGGGVAVAARRVVEGFEALHDDAALLVAEGTESVGGYRGLVVRWVQSGGGRGTAPGVAVRELARRSGSARLWAAWHRVGPRPVVDIFRATVLNAAPA